MMYAKAILFEDHAVAEQIRNTTDPRTQKALGRKVSNFDSEVWESNCKEIVYRGNMAKFTQNPTLKAKLLAESKGRRLVEASPTDTIWGIGLAADDPRAKDEAKWRGKNYLGELECWFAVDAKYIHDEKQEEAESLSELLTAGDDELRSFEANSLAPEFSGKLGLLAEMLASMRKSPTRQKVVIASLFGKTLDIIQSLCKERGYSFLRLDGSVAVGTRQRLVDRFNDSQSGVFVFLLASKAGGVGLNLVGANRLILFDGDWNPTTDQQTMARIWRDGQQDKCWIYRLLTTGTIDEKIFQRQVAKQALASVLVDDNRSMARRFSSEDLKDIFSLNLSTLSDTHDLIRCKCGVASSSAASRSQSARPSAAALDFLSGMQHLASANDARYDPLLQEISARSPELITMVFQSQTRPVS